MEKIEIKSIGVIFTVMILLNFAQAGLTKVSYCSFKCRITCFVQSSPFSFEKCVHECMKLHCSKLSPDFVYNCIIGCRLTKSLVINNGMYSKIFSSFMVLLFMFYFTFFFFLF